MTDDTKTDLARLMHLMSKDMGLRPLKVFGLTISVGVPEQEFLNFLNNPGSYLGTGNKPLEAISITSAVSDVIAVAKVICAASAFLNTSVCPLVNGKPSA